MKYLVIGAGGLLGEAFVRILAEGGEHEVVGLVRADVDLCDEGKLERILSELKFNVLINCAGLTGLEACLDNSDLARAVNVEAPRVMARVCGDVGARFVHFSTDYVFSGDDVEELDETCEVRAINDYGVSKEEGEREVLEMNSDALIARVSWVFGRGRRQFVDQVIENAQSTGVEYIGDKWSVPNYADDLVAMTLGCLEHSMDGVVHLVSSGGGVSWHEYALAVLELGREVGILDEGYELPNESRMSEVQAFRAKRPVNTVMISNRMEWLKTDFGWRDGIRRYLEWKVTFGNQGNR